MRRGWLLVLALCSSPGAFAQTLAFTFDDGPSLEDRVHRDAAGRNAALLDQLDALRLRSALFLTTREGESDRLALARQWGERGHVIANHTRSHRNYSNPRTSQDDFQQELLACDALIRTLPGYRRWFRFPYLKEGDTAAKRDGFRDFLRAQEYRAVPVTIDTSDWYYDSRLREQLRREPAADLAPYRAAYVAHLVERAAYYQGLAHGLLGRSPAQVMLLHHNLVNALFLADAAAALRERGWTLVDAEAALEDPLYQLQPDVLPTGDSLLLALARSRGLQGLRTPGEDGAYEKPLLDRLGL